jgi:hypothetical protein
MSGLKVVPMPVHQFSHEGQCPRYHQRQQVGPFTCHLDVLHKEPGGVDDVSVPIELHRLRTDIVLTGLLKIVGGSVVDHGADVEVGGVESQFYGVLDLLSS